MEEAIGGLAGLFGTHLTNKANKQISARQMAFQREMSNTAYQRSMADMKKAGLNPMLAFSKGGASTPQGASIQAQDYAAGAANIANIMANTNKTEEETKVLKNTSGSGVGKTWEYFQNLISDLLPTQDTTISSIKQKLENASNANNMRVKKRIIKGKTYKIPKVRRTTVTYPSLKTKTYNKSKSKYKIIGTL